MASVPELYMREALGVVASEKFGVFTSAQTTKMATSLRADQGETVGPSTSAFPVLVVVDPTGGASTKLALISE